MRPIWSGTERMEGRSWCSGCGGAIDGSWGDTRSWLVVLARENELLRRDNTRGCISLPWTAAVSFEGGHTRLCLGRDYIRLKALYTLLPVHRSTSYCFHLRTLPYSSQKDGSGSTTGKRACAKGFSALRWNRENFRSLDSLYGLFRSAGFTDSLSERA